MLRPLALGVAAALAFATGSNIAQATDLTIPATPAAPYNWSGFYIGGAAGYGWGQSNYLHKDQDDWFDFKGGTYRNDVSGLLGGIVGGVNLQLSNAIVLGVEGQYLASAVTGGKDYTQYHNSQQTDLNWLARIGGKIGVANDTWLFYGKGGYAVGSITAENLYYTAPTHAWSVTNNHGGWFLGVGIDKAVSQHVVIGLEANYTNLGWVDNNKPDSAGLPTNIANNLILGDVLATVKLKF
jgi:outer membrane immunogenic protein